MNSVRNRLKKRIEITKDIRKQDEKFANDIDNMKDTEIKTDKFCFLWCCKDGFKKYIQKNCHRIQICYEYQHLNNKRYFVKIKCLDKKLSKIYSHGLNTTVFIDQYLYDNKVIHSGVLLKENILCSSKFSNNNHTCAELCNNPNLDVTSATFCILALCPSCNEINCSGCCKCELWKYVCQTILKDILVPEKISNMNDVYYRMAFGAQNNQSKFKQINNIELLPECYMLTNYDERIDEYLDKLKYCINILYYKQRKLHIEYISASEYKKELTGKVIIKSYEHTYLEILNGAYICVKCIYNNEKNIYNVDYKYFIEEIFENKNYYAINFNEETINYIETENLISIEICICRNILKPEIICSEKINTKESNTELFNEHSNNVIYDHKLMINSNDKSKVIKCSANTLYNKTLKNILIISGILLVVFKNEIINYETATKIDIRDHKELYKNKVKKIVTDISIFKNDKNDNIYENIITDYLY